MTTKRITKKIVPVGANYNRFDAEELANLIVEKQIEREAQVAARDAEILAIQSRYAPDIDELDSEICQGLSILQTWAEANPQEFINAESTALSGHRVGFRFGNYATKLLSKWTWAKVIAAIKAAPAETRDKYLRVKEEANKEAMIADRADVETLKSLGVKIVQGRAFYLEPAREGQAETTLKN